MLVRLLFDQPGYYSILYRVPEKFINDVQKYKRVLVQLKNKKEAALIIDILDDEEPSFKNYNLVLRVIDQHPIVNEEQINIAEFMKEHYLCSMEEAIFRMIPSGRANRDQALEDTLPPKPETKKLLSDQRQTLEKINSYPKEGQQPGLHLIFGVTGSGKTRIYIELINNSLKEKKGVILLLPEIALSYHFLELLKPYYQSKMVLLHSSLSKSKRLAEYKKLQRGEALFVVGTRSAVFAPVKDLSLIILDEEHDTSYKEYQRPYYHAKTIAWQRLKEISKLHKKSTQLILGSATPSIESYFLVKQNRMQIYFLHKRATGLPLPKIHLVYHNIFDSEVSVFSTFLIKAIQTHLKKKMQVLLLLNRRGYNYFAFCKKCRKSIGCKRCSISLTYHKDNISVKNKRRSLDVYLQCHLCGHKQEYHPLCPNCERPLTLLGKGIQKVEDAIEFHFPSVPYARIDQDTARTKDYVKDILKDLREKRIKILIGTQMIAKGFDLPGVTLVGILNADVGLNLPDFRAVERVSQLLIQASGRAGRHSSGEVIMQTMQAENEAIQYASSYRYQNFLEKELQLRKKMNFPPYCRMVRITIKSEDEQKLKQFVNQVHNYLQHTIYQKNLFNDAADYKLDEILGPTAASIYKIREMYRYHLLLKNKKYAELHTFTRILEGYMSKIKKSNNLVKYEIDIDPIDML